MIEEVDEKSLSSSAQNASCQSVPEAADAECVNLLATGITNVYLPHLRKTQKSLQELVKSQDSVTETLQHENQRFIDSNNDLDLQQTIARVKLYHTKLLNIKKEMASLSDKSAKLKKRAERLQQQKQKEALQRETEREREEERERQLIAQVAKKS